MKKSLFGYGKTTKAIAQKLGGFDIYDDNFKKPLKDEFNNNLLPINYFNPSLSSLEIASPGFPKDHILVKQARNLISEYDFFYDIMPRSIWISGTNGKTTTTQITQHLLKSVGAVMGANIGIPLADLNPYAKLWILETSSFTLHYTKIAKPEIYALLPISTDHISWHGSFKAYEEAKLSVLSRMQKSDKVVLPQIYADIPTKADKITYKNEEDLAEKMNIDLKKINFKKPFLIDALIACSIEKIILKDINYRLLSTFKMEENKLEELKDHLGRIWINDTKATNESATLEALKRYKDKKIYLIIGGDDKGMEFKNLFNFMKKLDISLYIIGANIQKLNSYAQDYNIKAYQCHFLKEAIKEISKKLKKDEIALLSPACASLDQFSSYKERGEIFKKEIKQLNN
ncbi:UDP-N-acetylmuramoyl-L-alanine--D-glutamate ligase [Campylobacter sp. TTU-622]|uniref:UDP-N-acetylmuramoyl-L-alanine--D-glutamate ligase n=1 Tax=Campylobacter sp. TTU-622 TaxID=2800583 RepID=UPI00190727B0|nr:UDP-N-acetylmuramoyl-L-alanine--D-glutamate ligase [Campylobacter sp. TTU-622]MBK1973142.1 UDP-N-acetylmuramoyl-L-alanine--D-glutamate ligase [Campylobacter sp. TTU-622]